MIETLVLVLFIGPVVAGVVMQLLGRARKRRWLIVAGGICILFPVVSLGGFLLLGFISFVQASTPVTNIRRYPRIRREWQSPLIAHFPATVPPDAAHARCYYSPGMLQSATILQLRYQTTPRQLAALDARFRKQAMATFHGDEEAKALPHSPIFYTGNTKTDDTQYAFSADYTIMVLQVEDGPDNWNHNQTSGVAISATRREIVYWAESW